MTGTRLADRRRFIRYKAESEQGMNCEDCIYSDIADWEQNKKIGKAKAVYWCERHKKLCNDIQECQFEDNGEK